MHKKAIVVAVVAAVAGIVAALYICSRPHTYGVRDILAAYQAEVDYNGITIEYPADGTLFPREIVAPTFRWRDGDSRSEKWLVKIESADGAALHVLVDEPRWTPTPEDWQTIKQRSLERDTAVVVLGVQTTSSVQIVSGRRLAVRTSADEVGAPLFYREVNLPFVDAVKDPSHIRWRFGSIASPGPPPIILQNLPVCGNCHSFPTDAATLAMDVDYANSKGSYVITRIQQEMVLATSDIITWNEYKQEDGEQTFGLLSQISPDGRYVISTVKDKSVFVPKPGLAFSQLFFPIKGILCVYDRETGGFSALPGADDPAFVQSNPTWSPDGTSIVFARAGAYDLQHTRGQGKVLLTREECREFVEDGRPFQFDLYRIPFNEGRGGQPEPIEGASHNGMSNFFARHSPDGRWIVFCKAQNYMLLQPDSELYIIPAEGGPARRLRANTPRMNSWHSWSPNGKWLVFASKAYSDYTQLFLTHIDADGRSTPPVLLAHLTAPDRAANIPEFVNARPDAIAKIHERFLNDYSFVRAGNEFFRQGEPDRAIEEYSEAIRLNPDNVTAHHKMGFLLYHVKGRFDDGMVHLLKAYGLAPRDPRIHYDLGMAFFHQGRCEEAVRHLSEAMRGMPDGLDVQYAPARMHFHLGRALLAVARSEEAGEHFAETLRLEPNHAAARYQLALAQADLGRTEEAVAHYTKAVELQPAVDTSPTLHHLLATSYLEGRQFRRALQHEEKALQLARATGDEKLVETLKNCIAYCKRLIDASER